MNFQGGDLNIKTTAIYCRLSKDDEKIGESVSIETQKMMLSQFCKENGFSIFDYYVDDGFSGLNFQRPGFQKLLADVEAGKIDTVITKDLSRLGRDYIQTGYYIDIYFKEHNVRYIAMNDSIDTVQDNNDIAPFKNILNDMYAHDLSRKVKAAKKQRAMKGYFISGQAPYGYKIDPENKNHLIIDYAVAPCVQRLFQLAEKGNTLRAIAETMTNEGILSPGAYKAKNGDTRFERYTKDNANKWCVYTIIQILKDPVYIGNMVNHKDEVKNYKTKARRTVPREEWIIVENTHEPILPKELYDHVQEILDAKARPRRYHFENVLDGYVFCGECGHRMTQATKNRKNGRRYLLRCTNHFTHPEECKQNHAVFYDELIETVQLDLRNHLQIIGNMENASISLSRSAVVQWIDYIEIGRADMSDNTGRNQVVVHYRELTKEKQKKRKRNPYGFYGW